VKPENRSPPPAASDPWLEYIDAKIVWQPLERSMPQTRARVLDLGCGDGRIAIRLTTQGFRAVGADLRGGNGPRVIALAEHLPFKDASFDLVIMLLVLMHIPAEDLVMREVRRVTKVGGKLLVAVGNRQSFTGLAVREQSPRFLMRRIPYAYYRSYNKNQLARLLAGKGFKVETLRSVTFVPNFLSKAGPALVWRFLALAKKIEGALERIPLLRWSGIRIFAVAEAVEP